MKMNIEKILDEAKTEEQKKMKLARIQKEIKKHRLLALVYGLVYLVNTSFLLIAFYTLLCDEVDKAAWKELPDIIIKILEASNKWILSVPEWAVFDIINELIFGKTGALPIWLIYLIAIATVMLVVPVIILLIVKAIIAVFFSGNRCRPLKGTLLEGCKKTGKMFKRIPWVGDVDYDISLYFGLTYVSIAIPCIIAVVLMIVDIGFYIYEEWGSKDIVTAILELVAVAIVLFLIWAAYMLIASGIAIVSSTIAAWGMMEVSKGELVGFWAEVDPEKKAELERQRELRERSRELERRKDAELKKIMEEQAQRPQVPISCITGKPVEYKPERSFTDGGPTGCGIGGSFCGCGAGR